MSLTNVSLPEALHGPLKLAVDYYEFDNLGAFYRACSRALVRQYQRGEALILPLTFSVDDNGADHEQEA